MGDNVSALGIELLISPGPDINIFTYIYTIYNEGRKAPEHVGTQRCPTGQETETCMYFYCRQ